MTLRDRIAAILYRHVLFRALDQCECGAAFDGFCGRSLDAYAAHVAEAVIRELGLREESSTAHRIARSSPVFIPTMSHRYVTEWQPDE